MGMTPVDIHLMCRESRRPRYIKQQIVQREFDLRARIRGPRIINRSLHEHKFVVVSIRRIAPSVRIDIVSISPTLAEARLVVTIWPHLGCDIGTEDPIQEDWG